MKATKKSNRKSGKMLCGCSADLSGKEAYAGGSRESKPVPSV